MDELSSQIIQMSEDQLDSLFGDAPATDDKKVENTKELGGDENELVSLNSESNGIEQFDDVEIEGEAATTPAEETDVDDTTVEDDSSIKEGETSPSDVKVVLKNTVDYLIEQGIWVDFEGREDLEMTEELYAELAAKQNLNSAYSIVDELINETGEYGKAIIAHIKNGGNPDEIIDIFKEQKEVNSIDISTEDGKVAFIKKYYEEALGWKKEKVEKHVNRIIQDDEVDAEYTDTKELSDEYFKEQILKKENAQKEISDKRIKEQNEFTESIKKAITDNPNITAKEKKILQSSILDFNHKLDNGKSVNAFYLRFAEIQKNPNDYIEMVRYVMNPENFKKEIIKKEETKAAVKSFNFIKGNSAVTKNSSQVKTEVVNKKGTDFSFSLKK